MLRIVSIAITLFFCSVASGLAVNVGEPAPDFNLVAGDGSALSLSDFRDKGPLMVVFWATWCDYCTKEIPQIEKVVEDFSGRGLSVIAVNVAVNDSLRRMNAYRDKYHIKYPLVFDEGSRMTRTYGVYGTPTVIILDRRGIVRYRAATVPENIEENFSLLVE